MVIRKIVNKVPIMVDFEIGGVLFRTQEKNLQRAPESLLVSKRQKDQYSTLSQASFYFFEHKIGNFHYFIK